MTTDRLFDVEALRQWADYTPVRADQPGWLMLPERVWNQLVSDVLASADELDLRALEARRLA